jgi:hypothetical protein
MEETMVRRNAAGGVVALAATAVIVFAFKEWSAMIRPVDGSTVSGTATAVPRSGDTLDVNIRIKGGKIGDTHPWHLHSGGCDSSGAVLGDPSRYQPMPVSPMQTGEATAHVVTRLTVGVPYSVNVHRSTSDMGVIACGNLRPVAGAPREDRGR